MEKKKSLSVPKSGMQRNTSPHLLQADEYTFMLNGNNETSSGNRLNLTNEPSNLFGVDFPTDFKVIGYKSHLNSDTTFFFLTNPTTGFSSIGYVSNIQNVQSTQDLEVECDNCNYTRVLDEPLEAQTQTPSHTYIELINDACNGDLNLDINFPIKFLEIKDEKLGRVIYFTDFRNPARKLEVDNIEKYLYTGEINCGIDNTVPTCVDAFKLLLQPNHQIPKITPELLQTGGNLKMGTYEFLVAYSDQDGNEISEYYSITNPISIFDENNRTLSQPELDAQTNFAIKLKVENLDSNFSFYKVVVIERTNLAQGESYFVEGIHSITDDSILYSSTSTPSQSNITGSVVTNRQRTTLENILAVRARYEKVRGLVTSNNYLFLWGLIGKKQPNLQPIANLIGGFVQWQSSVAKEDLYKSAIATSKYKGYNRDEVQPFGIKFENIDGTKTPVFPLVARPATEEDLQSVSEGDINKLSIEKNAPNCTNTDRDKKWQLFNTATLEGNCEGLPEGDIVVEDLTKICLIANVETIPGDVININIDDNYTDFQTYINDNYDDIINPVSPKYIPEIAPYLIDTYPSEHCTPNFGNNCDTPILEGSEVVVSEVVGEVNILVEKAEANYVKTLPPEFCQLYKASTTVPGEYQRDVVFEENYMSCNGASREIVYKRQGNFNNEDCIYAPEVLDKSDPLSSPIGYFNNYHGASNTSLLVGTKTSLVNTYVEEIIFNSGTSGGADITINGVVYPAPYSASLVGTATLFETTHGANIATSTGGVVTRVGTSIFITAPINGYTTSIVNSSGDLLVRLNANGFTSKLHKGTLYYKVNKLGRDKLIFEVTKNTTDCSNADNTEVTKELRYNFFNDCSSTTAVSSAIVNTTLGILLEVDVTTFTEDYFIVAVDTPIISESIQVESCSFIGTPTFKTIARVAPPCGCYGVYSRSIEYVSNEVTYTRIILDKRETYKASCEFTLPQISDCEPFPYQYGKTAYWESIETYPDNEELYDSTTLEIAETDLSTLTEEQKNLFEDYYVSATITGQYTLKEDVDLRCKPIRHYKFPSNQISPFMGDINAQPFAESLIFPLGISLDSEVVNVFLNIAVKNNLLTQAQRDGIVGYEILKGDNTVNKSILAKAVASDVYRYSENGKNTFYPNYPLNDLGTDLLHFEGFSLIQHPFGSIKNNKFTLLSPDFSYSKPALPTEVWVDGFQMGNSKGFFSDVEGHSRWVVLGKDAKAAANTLAGLEVVLEIAINVAQFTTQSALGNLWFTVGTSGGTNAAGAAASAGALGAYLTATAVSGPFKFGQYRLQWLKIIRDLGTPINHASYYVAEGYHNKFLANENSTNLLRALAVKKYTKNGKFTFTDENNGEQIRLNNYGREQSVFISLGDFFINYPTDIVNYDNNIFDLSTGSRTIASQNGCPSGLSGEIQRNSAFPYMTLKNYVPDQFGTINSITWLTTGYSAKLGDATNCETIFGGTIFISRDWQHKKLPIFRDTAIGLADREPYSYSLAPNVGFPRFFTNYETGGNSNLGSALFPTIDSETHFDCTNEGMYFSKPSKFYLFYHGFVSYLVESEINCNFRYARTEIKDQFYPEFADMLQFTQEKTRSIFTPNSYFYNSVYSRPVTRTAYTVLPTNYSKEVWDKISDAENGTVYSLQDNNENSLVDPWIIFRPLDKFEFPTRYGKLIQLKDLESATILGRFENQKVLFNAIDNLADQNSPILIETGTGGIFTKRPIDYKATDLGFAGTQHSEMVSTPYGHFDIDAKRGKIFQLDQNGQNLQPISDLVGGKESGLKNWFREQLPFKILKYIPELDIDNKFKGIGISMGWDARFDRVFITKKDYVLKTGVNKNSFTIVDGKLFYNEVEVFFNNTTLFEDVSWTVAFKPLEQAWVSYYDFKPDYYLAHNNYFQTGLNYSNSSNLNGTLWSHLLTNRSYQVFYGTLYPFIVEFPQKNENVNKVFNNTSINVEARRYQNEWDFSVLKTAGFNKAEVYNSTNNSGVVNLIQQKTLSDIGKYPKTNTNNTQDILITSFEGKHNFNYIYNRVINQDSNVQQYLWDKCMINKQVNPHAVSFKNYKQVLERLRGDVFLVRLTNDLESRYNIEFKNTINTEQIY